MTGTGNHWRGNWRADFFAALQEPLDVLIIGGGITGAGVLQAAVNQGLRVALVEQRDFAWGSSSRSSKLVHGGLRYLKQGHLGLTAAALKARNALQQQYPETITPRRFYLPYAKHPPRMIQTGLALYDVLAGRRSRAHHARDSWLQQFPFLRNEQRQGALSYLDAATDDCQLVLRVLMEAMSRGAFAANYVAAESLLQDREQKVVGAVLRDQSSDQQFEVRANVVVNATGAWSDRLLAARTSATPMRPLRGSHLVLPWHLLPLAEAIGCPHPQDGRPVYAVPWAGAVLFGTTDVDHDASLDLEPRLSSTEYDYLMSALFRLFPELEFKESDIVSSFAGVRPTFADQHADPSAASREHLVEESAGFVRICGGKLTTFQLMADDVLTRICRQLGRIKKRAQHAHMATTCVHDSSPHFIGDSDLTEQHWQAALTQAVQHLDDLLLRRTRIGLIERDGGLSLLQQRQAQICRELNWDNVRWQQECTRYHGIRERHYAAQAFRY